MRTRPLQRIAPRNDDLAPTLTSIGRCLVGTLHGPSDKGERRSPWSTGIPEHVRLQAYIAAHNVTRQLPTRRATQVLRTALSPLWVRDAVAAHPSLIQQREILRILAPRQRAQIGVDVGR